MSIPPKLKRTQQRHFAPHHILLYAATKAYERAKTPKVPGRDLEILVTLTMSALAVEALANSIGQLVVTDWDDIEPAPPVTKLRVLAQTLGVTFSKTDDPWKTVLWLLKFRNRVAQAKPELLEVTTFVTQQEHDTNQFDYPRSKLERDLTLGNARSAVESVDDLLELLVGRVESDDRFSLLLDGWTTSLDQR